MSARCTVPFCGSVAVILATYCEGSSQRMAYRGEDGHRREELCGHHARLYTLACERRGGPDSCRTMVLQVEA